MIQEIIRYPDERINIASADVRKFDKELDKLVQDMKETIDSHEAEGLAAIQIAVPLSVVVAKDTHGDWHTFCNPRILKSAGKTPSLETSLYLPDIEEEIPRHEQITFIYQDRMGKQHSMTVSGHFSYLLQRKFDYTFGGTFANKLDRKHRKMVEQKLSINGTAGEFNADSTFSKRDYFKSAINKLLFFEGMTFFAQLFQAKKETLQSLYYYDIFATIMAILLTIGYVVYAKYEASKVISCTGCQVVSFSAVAIKYFILITLLFAGSYYFVNPN